jgi:hypothetical protein
MPTSLVVVPTNPPRLLCASPPFNPPLFLQLDQTTCAKVDALVVILILLIWIYIVLVRARSENEERRERGLLISRARIQTRYLVLTFCLAYPMAHIWAFLCVILSFCLHAHVRESQFEFTTPISRLNSRMRQYIIRDLSWMVVDWLSEVRPRQLVESIKMLQSGMCKEDQHIFLLICS